VNLRKVFLLLKKVKPAPDVLLKISKSATTDNHNRKRVLIGADGEIYYDDTSAIAGCIGGFSTNDIGVAYALSDLRMITKAEAKAFHSWFCAEDAAQIRRSKIKELHQWADELGYKLIKLKKDGK
jgi:hypothetical protein